MKKTGCTKQHISHPHTDFDSYRLSCDDGKLPMLKQVAHCEVVSFA